MNIIRSLSIFALVVGSCLSEFEYEEPREFVSPDAIVSFVKKASHRELRHLVTEFCIIDTEALHANNPTLAAARTAYQNELEDQAAYPTCIEKESATHCTVKPNTAISFPTYPDACMALGGKGVTHDGSMFCTGKYEGHSALTVFHFVDIFDCVAPSCPEDLLAADSDLAFKQLEFDLLELGWTCRKSVYDETKPDETEPVATKSGATPILSVGASVFVLAAALWLV